MAVYERTLDSGETSTGDTSGKNHSTKMVMEALLGVRWSRVCCVMLRIYGVGTEEGI